MSQHDYVIDNQDGASFRVDINNALQASGKAPIDPTTAELDFQPLVDGKVYMPGVGSIKNNSQA